MHVEIALITADDWRDARRLRPASLADAPQAFSARYDDELAMGATRAANMQANG